MKERIPLGLHIVIAEPRPIVRTTFHSYLSHISSVERVYEATTVREMEQHLSTHPMHMILLSQALLADVSLLSSRCFLLLTKQQLDIETLFTMYSKGVEGYLRPDIEEEEFQLALPLMLMKQPHVFFLDPTTTPLLKDVELNILTKARLTTLSEREREVLYLRNEGVENAEIAQRLYITEATVRSHIKNLCDKLGVTTSQLPTLHLPERPTHPPPHTLNGNSERNDFFARMRKNQRLLIVFLLFLDYTYFCVQGLFRS